MKLIKFLQKLSAHRSMVGWFACAFLAWIFIFRHFLLSHLTLTSDAVSYYDHIKFFVDNIGRGVFPLWDPTWSYGSPNAFFLRRIGPFNPCLLFLIFLSKIGLPYTFAYMLYLSAYYFFGCVGFYLLCQRTFQNRIVSLTAFALLYFSALGTRLFDSYLWLMVVPFIWFFYFWFGFTQTPHRLFLLGMTLCAMVIATTYIPFYFFVIWLTFVLCFGLFYSQRLKELFSRYWSFAVREKWIVVMCVCALLVACIPGYSFFKEAKQGEFVLPLRYSTSNVASALGVEDQSTNAWSTPEELMYSSFFSDLRRYKPAVLYIPLLAFLILALGLLTKISRRMLFLMVWIGSLFLITTPSATPIYHFFFEHVFFFKYFRNLHFFLWVILLPLLIVFVAEQLYLLLDNLPINRPHRWKGIMWVVMVHTAAFIFLWWQKEAIVSSYVVTGGSLALCLMGRWDRHRFFSAAAISILFLVVLQAGEVYTYFSKNSEPYAHPYQYDYPYLKFAFTRGEKTKEDADVSASGSGGVSVYFGTQWYNYLTQNVKPAIFQEYARHKFILYDQIEFIRDQTMDIKSIEQSWRMNRNLAYVSLADQEPKPPNRSPSAHPPAEAIFLTENTPFFKVSHYDVNAIRFQTNFTYPQFLVYNDSFHSHWRAAVDDKPVDVYRANVAFKGLWIPAGEHRIVLRYGSSRMYGLNYFILFVYYALFFVLLRMAIGRFRRAQKIA